MLGKQLLIHPQPHTSSSKSESRLLLDGLCHKRPQTEPCSTAALFYRMCRHVPWSSSQTTNGGDSALSQARVYSQHAAHQPKSQHCRLVRCTGCFVPANRASSPPHRPLTTRDYTAHTSVQLSAHRCIKDILQLSSVSNQMVSSSHFSRTARTAKTMPACS